MGSPTGILDPSAHRPREPLFLPTGTKEDEGSGETCEHEQNMVCRRCSAVCSPCFMKVCDECFADHIKTHDRHITSDVLKISEKYPERLREL